MKQPIIAVNISWNPHHWQKPYTDPRAGHSYARKHPGHESVNFHFNKSGIDSKTHVYGFSQWRHYPKQFSNGGYVVFYTRNLDANEKGGVTSWFVNCRKVSDEEYKSANSQYKM